MTDPVTELLVDGESLDVDLSASGVKWDSLKEFLAVNYREYEGSQMTVGAKSESAELFEGPLVQPKTSFEKIEVVLETSSVAAEARLDAACTGMTVHRDLFFNKRDHVPYNRNPFGVEMMNLDRL